MGIKCIVYGTFVLLRSVKEAAYFIYGSALFIYKLCELILKVVIKQTPYQVDTLCNVVFIYLPLCANISY